MPKRSRILDVSFKPLRSGALDRTALFLYQPRQAVPVSNPFVAGHWIVLLYAVEKQRPDD